MGPGGIGGPPMGGRPPGKREWREGRPEQKRGQAQSDDFAEKDFNLEQMERESEDMVRMTLLNRENASFARNSGGGLMLVFEGKNYADVQIVETFPFTAPDSYLSVRNPLMKNKELGMIEDLEKDFEADTVAVIREYLERCYHMPKIEKIMQVKEAGGFTHFTVMTDYGENQFSIRSNGTCITALTENRLIIQDLENNRFEIPDKRKLPAKDLKRLDVFM